MGEQNDASSGGAATAASTLLLSSLRSLSGGGASKAPGGGGGGGGRNPTRSMAAGGVTVDRILGGAVTLGLSIALLRLSVQFWYLAWRRRRGAAPGEKDDGGPLLPLSAYLPLFVHLALRRWMGVGGPGGADDHGSEGSSSSDLDSCGSDSPDSYFRAVHEGAETNTDGSTDGSESSAGGGPIRGSCHCGAVRFALLRRQTPCGEEGATMSAYDCPGKIRYPRVRLDAPSAEFRILEGEAYLQMYYDSVQARPAGTDEDENFRSRSRRQSTAAHAFCNQCGVHVLHAPDSDADVLEVNANCLDWDSTPSRRRGGGGGRRQMPPIEVTWRPRPPRTRREDDRGGKKSSSAATPSTEGTSSSSSFGSDFSFGITPMPGGGTGDAAAAVAAVVSPATRLSPPAAAAVGRSLFPVVDDDGISTLAGDATYASPRRNRGWPSTPSPSSLSASGDVASPTLATTPASASATSSSSAARRKVAGVDPAVREKVLYYMKRHLNTPPSETKTAAEAGAETSVAAGVADGRGEGAAAAGPGGEST